MTVSVFLSHDIDWPKKGPSVDHIESRKSRFDANAYALWKYKQESLYYNIPEITEIENDLGLASTFFFRSYYEDEVFNQYIPDMRILNDSSWEVGLHSNDPTKIKYEKQALERDLGKKTNGIRAHYLRTDDNFWNSAKECGFKYDSSVCLNKEKFNTKNCQPFYKDGLLVLPISMADCYMFTYWGQTETTLFHTLEILFDRIARLDNPLLTLDWHDCSLKMRGGRKYREVLRYLKNKDVNFLTGIEAYERFKG